METRYTGSMRYNNHPKKGDSMPYLSIEVSGPAGEKIGFLHINSAVKKIEIGAATSQEFRLVQCLFSPQNNLFAKYNPVTQTYERACDAIGIKSEHEHMLESSLQNLRKGKTAGFLSVISQEGRLRMEIVA